MGCAHCEDLREEIAYLKSELGLTLSRADRVKMRVAFGMDAAEAAILYKLYAARGRMVEHYDLMDVLPTENDDRNPGIIKVYICRIRHKIGKASIRTVYSEGYGLTPEGMKAVTAALEMRAAA